MHKSEDALIGKVYKGILYAFRYSIYVRSKHL